MRQGIVYYPNSSNRGDDIQTYAASLLTEDAMLCDREHLNDIKTPTKLLCNGYVKHKFLHSYQSRQSIVEFDHKHVQ